METSKTKLGADHPDTLTSMANLALTYWSQGRWAEAEKLEVEVMETRKTKLGADHPDTLMSMANLAARYSYQGLQDEGKKLKVQVMETRKKLGVYHPSTLSSMANLAFTWRSQGRHADALTLMESCAVNILAQRDVDIQLLQEDREGGRQRGRKDSSLQDVSQPGHNSRACPVVAEVPESAIRNVIVTQL